MSELSQEIQVLADDVRELRSDIERLRAELRSVFEGFLLEHQVIVRGIGEQPGGMGGRNRAVRAPRAQGIKKST